MGKSEIEWTDETWNPVTGCEKVSQGCKFCYAERVFPRPYPGRKFTDVRMHEDRLDQPLRWKRPRKVFVNSMSDLFHESVSANFLREVFGILALASRHTFQILTKRPKRMLEMMGYLQGFGVKSGGCQPAFGQWPLPNVWLGVSVEDQATADERIPLLLQTPAAVRWVSYEPALGPVDFSKYLPKFDVLTGGWKLQSMKHLLEDTLDWVVAGGESGPKARQSELAWYRSVRDQCSATGVPFFMKQLGANPTTRIGDDQAMIPFRITDRKGGNIDDFPEDLKIREYPVQSCTTKA